MRDNSSRIPGSRMSARRIALASGAAPPPSTPATIMGANTLLWVRADLGVTLGVGVSAWADQSGNGRDLTQSTGASQPAYTASDATLGNLPSITFDGADDYLANAAYNRPAPGTTPTFAWGVFKLATWTSGRHIFGRNSAGTLRVMMGGASPQLRGENGVNGALNGAATLGSWFRFECLFNNSTTDYLKIGGTSATGINCGNGARTGLNLAALGTALPANVVFAEFCEFDILPSGGQLAALDAYVVARYGAGLT